MSKFITSIDQGVGRLTALVPPLETIMRDKGDDFVSDDAALFVVSSESITDAKFEDIRTEYNGLVADLESLAKDNDIELTQAQLDAGAIIAMSSKNPVNYHNLATDVNGGNFSKNAVVIEPPIDGDYGSIDYRTEIGTEAFDERDLRKQIATSTVFNIAAAKQEEFSETFYPTVVLTPDQAGLEMTINPIMVHQEVRRKGTGEVTDFDKKNLIHATADHTILESRATDIVPYFNPNDSNKDKFVDTDLLEPRDVDIDGIPVRTSALAMGVGFDLLGLSQAPGILNGEILDSTDSLDSRIGLRNIYLHVMSGQDDKTIDSLVIFNTYNLPRSLFNKSSEGMGYEMELNFRTDAVSLHSLTKDKSGSLLVDSVPGLEKYSLQFKCAINGTANVETGMVEIHTTKLSVESIFDSDGTLVSESDPGYVDAFKDVDYEVVGYDLEASRTNTNLRTRGLILDVDSITEAHKVGLGAPISVPAPVSSSGRTGVDLKALISATRTKTGNIGITSLLNFVSRMKSYSHAIEKGEPVRAVEGIGRHLIKPVFIEKTIDLKEIVDSERSSDKAEDIRSAIVEVLRYSAYRMVVDSNYREAIDFDTGGGNTMPKLIIGTDPITARYIIEFGDDRTMSESFKDFKIVTTTDTRMKDKIIMTFTRDTKGADPLSFGVHLYVPELTSTVQVTRNGSTTKENQVQPRDIHVNNLPIVALVNVENLAEVIETKVPLVTV